MSYHYERVARTDGSKLMLNSALHCQHFALARQKTITPFLHTSCSIVTNLVISDSEQRLSLLIALASSREVWLQPRKTKRLWPSESEGERGQVLPSTVHNCKTQAIYLSHRCKRPFSLYGAGKEGAIEVPCSEYCQAGFSSPVALLL